MVVMLSIMKNKSSLSLSLWEKADEALYDDKTGALSKRRRLKSQPVMKCLKLLGKVPSKSQSAMEYLMTYGWAY